MAEEGYLADRNFREKDLGNDMKAFCICMAKTGFRLGVGGCIVCDGNENYSILLKIRRYRINLTK